MLHADEDNRVAMLKPGAGKTHRAYLHGPTHQVRSKTPEQWSTTCEPCRGACAFVPEGWQGSLVCDDFSGYKAFTAQGIIEVGCLAHARRKFFDLHATSKSVVAESALLQFGRIYEVERDLQTSTAAQRLRQRHHAKPLLDALHLWMLQVRQKVPEGSATARALDYGLRRWEALTRSVSDGRLPIDNNHIENQIRPVAIGRNNWLFAGSLRAGQKAAAAMSLVQSARLKGTIPMAPRTFCRALPTQRASLVHELLPHRWHAPS